MNGIGGRGSTMRRYAGDANTELAIHAASRLLAGVSVKVVAAEAGVSVRTAYRWRKGLRSLGLVTVDGWTATFARFAYRPPVRISAWERIA